MTVRISRRLAALCLFMTLSACAGGPAPEPHIEAVTVPVAVPVRCRPDLGLEPAYPDTEAALRAAPDLYGRVRLLVAGRLLRIARDARKTAALAACAG
jgi:hypothetical protein